MERLTEGQILDIKKVCQALGVEPPNPQGAKNKDYLSSDGHLGYERLINRKPSFDIRRVCHAFGLETPKPQEEERENNLICSVCGQSPPEDVQNGSYNQRLRWLDKHNRENYLTHLLAGAKLIPQNQKNLI